MIFNGVIILLTTEMNTNYNIMAWWAWNIALVAVMAWACIYLLML